MEIKGNQIFAADGKRIFRNTDTKRQTPMTKCLLLTGDTLDSFVEIDASEVLAPSDTPVIPYGERVDDLIRERYSLSEELAILRQKDAKPEEYEAYYNFAEECKTKAREERI